MPKIASVTELQVVLKDVKPFAEASEKAVSAILHDCRLLIGDPSLNTGRKEQQVLGNALLVMSAHITGLERKLKEAQDARSAGFIRACGGPNA